MGACAAKCAVVIAGTAVAKGTVTGTVAKRAAIVLVAKGTVMGTMAKG